MKFRFLTLASLFLSVATGSSALSAPSSDQGRKLMCIYFDQKDAKDSIGPLHARMLENLMGAFKGWSSARRDSSRYRAGDFDSCDAAFYLATNFSLNPGEDFYADAARFSMNKTLVWSNYKLSDFAAAYKKVAELEGLPALAFDATKIDQPLQKPGPGVEDPGFYRYFEYKGETFEKLSKWDAANKIFMSSPELALVEIKDAARVDVLSYARHSQTQRKTPYFVKQKQARGAVWYVADSPMTFVHYEDRYLILCDLMWDILNEPAPPGPLGALVRIEDVNPSQNQSELRWVMEYLSSQGVPFSLATIPFYSNIYGDDFTRGHKANSPITEYKDFVGTLKYAQKLGANFVWHGVYHQAGDFIGGYDGYSGADYEFWMYPENRPLDNDSSDFIIGEFERGEEVFRKLGIKPIAWEVPHYAASALDNVLFGKFFEWNYHRSLYFWSDVTDASRLGAQHRMFNCVTAACRAERRAEAGKIQVDVHDPKFAGQIIPFRVWKDSYGQALIPETLGFVDYPFYNDNTTRPISRPEDLLRRAKLLKVVRGSFASFFWHSDLNSPEVPYYLRHPGHFETQGGRNIMIKLVEGLKGLGYNFASIGDCSLFPREDCRR